MDFFTRSSKSAWFNSLVWLVGLALVALFAYPAQAQTSGVDLAEFRVERSDAGLHLSAQLRLELAPAVEEALLKGVPIHFVAEASLRRDRWYWTDKSVSAHSRHWRLAYQPLTRLWRLSSAAEPLSGAAPGASFIQNFDTLGAALEALRRINRWKIAEATEMEASSRYNLEFRFRLDLAQLPRPLQIGAVGQNDWNLSVMRNQRLPSETGK